jgi:hypothetical protein
MVLNAKENTAASLMAAKHPARASNATDAGTVSAQATVLYYGDVNVFDENATRIPKGTVSFEKPAETFTTYNNAFIPSTLDQIAQLEVQVTRKTVTKITA